MHNCATIHPLHLGHETAKYLQQQTVLVLSDRPLRLPTLSHLA